MSSQKENRRPAKQHKKTTPTQRQDREAAVKNEAKTTRPSRFQLTDFLPTTKKEVELRGWDQLDIILFSGDAYIDHPAFGAAIVAAKRISRDMPNANIVVIAPDGVEKYLSLLDFANNEYVK